MSDPKFSTGPWQVGGILSFDLNDQSGEGRVPSDEAVVWIGEDDDPVGEIQITGEHAEANARLIAAAPDLYEALQDIVEQFGKSRLAVGADLGDAINVFGKQALAKAEGTP